MISYKILHELQPELLPQPDVSKRKEQERTAKRKARTSSISRIVKTDTAPRASKHCGGFEYSSRRSKRCPRHTLDINETIFQNLGQNENFTVSLPLRSFIRKQQREQLHNRKNCPTMPTPKRVTVQNYALFEILRISSTLVATKAL